MAHPWGPSNADDVSLDQIREDESWNEFYSDLDAERERQDDKDREYEESLSDYFDQLED